jgi:hypothetical protein
VNEATAHLRALAARLAALYVAHTSPRAVLLTGSAAGGESDVYSDLDLIAYYDALPSEQAAARAYQESGGTDFRSLGAREGKNRGEAFTLHGVECQVGHVTIAAWEDDIAGVIERLEVAAPTQKAIEGLLRGLPLHGEALIQGWRARVAAYPDALARAMVEHYLRFYPLWCYEDWMATRDATVWFHQILVESAYGVLGALAGLNRRYFSPFQFKRAHAFIDQLEIAPADLAARIESLFAGDRAAAVAELERLVAETVALVEARLPAVDTSATRACLGRRQQPWRPAAITPESAAPR